MSTLVTTKNNTSGLDNTGNKTVLNKQISIKWKLLAVCVLLVSIPTIFLGVVGYHTFKLRTQHNTESLMRKIALDWRQVTQTYIMQTERVLRREEALVKQKLHAIVQANSLLLSYAAQTHAFPPRVPADWSGITDKLSQVDIGRSGFVFLTDGKGKCLFSKDKIWQDSNIKIFLSPDNIVPPDQFISHVKNFSRDKSDIFLFSTADPETGKARKQVAAVMYFEPWDMIIGALTFHTDYKSHKLEKKLQNELRYRIAEQRIGRYGYIYVLNSKGDYIVSLDRLRDGENILHHQDETGTFFIKKLISETKRLGLGQTMIQYYPWQNLNETVPHKKFAAATYVPEWDWIIAASTYEYDYLKGFDKIRLQFILFCAVAIGLGSCVGYFFAAHLSRPIKILNRLTLKAAHGNLDVKIQETITDQSNEIGSLARSFQVMIHNLKTLIDQKEAFSEKLLIKNKELALAKEKLEIALSESETLAQKAQQASRAKSAFLATMSHELRTPLSAILGYAQLMLLDKNMDPVFIKRLKVIMKSGEHLLTIINDILDIAKIEAQKLDLVPSEFHFPKFLETIALMVELQAQQKQIALIRDFDPTLPTYIKADEKRLKQVIINLLNNAVKYTEQGSIVFQVKTVAAQDIQASLTQIVFSVTDTGIGISNQNISRIFEPFKRVGDIESQAGGTGLGLAISKQIIKKMGGDLGVESKPEQGSRFFFKLDMEISSINKDEHHEPVTRGGFLEESSSKALIVDDIDTNRELLRDMLDLFGCSIQEAEDGEIALEKVEQWKPDFILLDLNMPRLNGYDVLVSLRGKYNSQALKIIIISGNANIEEQTRCIEAGADGFLAKPFDMDNLESILEELLIKPAN